MQGRSAHFFRAPKSVLSGDIIGRSVGQWLHKSQLGKFVPGTAGNRPAIDDRTRPEMGLHGWGPDLWSGPQRNNASAQVVSEEARPTRSSLFPTAVTAAMNKRLSTSLPSSYTYARRIVPDDLYSHASQVLSEGLTRPRSRVTKVTVTRQAADTTDAPISPATRNPSVGNTVRSLSNGCYGKQNIPIAAPILAANGSDEDGLPNGNPAPGAPNTTRGSGAPGVGGHGSIGAGIAVATIMRASDLPTAADFPQMILNNRHAQNRNTSNSWFQRNVTSDGLSGSEKSVGGSVGQTSARDSALSTPQLSGIVGELQLDTLSLRNWLQAYLTTELRHAQLATNRTGGVFADM
jgi:hypothetical protein